jgi:hypothetical protein
MKGEGGLQCVQTGKQFKVSRLIKIKDIPNGTEADDFLRFKPLKEGSLVSNYIFTLDEQLKHLQYIILRANAHKNRQLLMTPEETISNQ